MSNPEYNLIIDLDDVLYPFCDGILAVLAKEGITGSITRWEIEEDFEMEQEEFWDLVYQPKHSETLYLQKTDHRTIEQLRRLHYAGHRIHIVTAREGEIAEDFARQVILRDAIPADSITFTRDKGSMVHELNASFSLDDGPHNYEALDQPGHLAFLKDAPHNGGASVPMGRRIKTMNEFTAIVLAFQQAGVQMRGAIT